jgi:predicted ATPase
MQQLPRGTVTFLFTDIEGSTRLLHELGDGYGGVLADHHRLLRQVWVRHGGVEVDTAGDAFFVVFARAADAVRAAGEAQRALETTGLRVRIGIHTGEAQVTETGYIGIEVHRAARIAAAAHGGQVVASRATRDLVEAGLEDLGEHRLKDFDEPVWLFQLGAGSFPPLRTVANTNLPRPASSFVGRERELGEVVALLESGARLVTLSGPGGTGKTRLAIEAATEVVPVYANGVFWIPLASVRDSTLVLATIEQVVGARDGLPAHFSGKRALLLIDNAEQVVDAGPELARLVATCPGLTMLVTSRELLRVQGEVEYAVPPLAGQEAIDLFCARSHLDADAAVAELCRRLDHLPLAVELAAARTNVLSPKQILNRLSRRLDLFGGGRDAESRHATLRATIEWSHDLLDQSEQRLFARLAVFVGGSTLEAAEQVCGADLDRLSSLVDKNLVRRTEERHWMLETVRELAAERLAAAPDAEDVRSGHAAFYLALVEEAEPELRGARQTELLDALEREHPNIRAALDRLCHTDAEGAARLAGACWYFWYLRAHFPEGRERLEAALECDDGLDARVRARLLDGLVVLESLAHDLGSAAEHADESLRLYRALGETQGLLRALLNQGTVAFRKADLERAEAVFRELTELARRVDDTWYLAVALGNTGAIAIDREDHRRAHELYSDAVELARGSGDEMLLVAWETTLAGINVELGRMEEASRQLAVSLAAAERLRLREIVLWGLEYAATFAARTGTPRRAAHLFSAAGALGVTIGWVTPPRMRDRRERTLRAVRDALGRAEFDRAWQKGAEFSSEAAVAYALDTLAA